MMRGQRGWRELAVLGDKINKFSGMIEGLIWSPRSGDKSDQVDDWAFEEVFYLHQLDNLILNHLIKKFKFFLLLVWSLICIVGTGSAFRFFWTNFWEHCLCCNHQGQPTCCRKCWRFPVYNFQEWSGTVQYKTILCILFCIDGLVEGICAPKWMFG